MAKIFGLQYHNQNSLYPKIQDSKKTYYPNYDLDPSELQEIHDNIMKPSLDPAFQ